MPVTVGARVRVRSSVSEPRFGWGQVDHSSVGTVKRIYDDGEKAKVDFPDQSGWSSMVTELEVVGGAAGGRLTTNDAVLIKSGNHRAGERGKIIKDDGPGDPQPYKVRFSDSGTHWYAADKVSGTHSGGAVGRGDRVRRGPDWKWGTQDENGPGTVISGCDQDGWIRVRWDSGSSNNYRNGQDGCYDLRKVDGSPASESYYVGQRVECRDSGESWRPGAVTQIAPRLKVRPDSWSGTGASWDEVRAVAGSGGALKVGDDINALVDSSDANWQGCRHSHLAFSTGDDYKIARIEGKFLLTTSYTTLWAPINAWKKAGVSLASEFVARELEGYHPGIVCDRTGQNPIVGNRYKLDDENYDVCEAEFLKMPGYERAQYTCIPPPVFRKPGRLTVNDMVVIRAGHHRAGQHGEIIKDDGPEDSTPYKVMFADGETHWYNADNVERAGSSMSAGGRLTVHDSVIIRATGGDDHRAGQRGKIIKDDGPGDRQPYKVQFEDGETHWYKAASVERAGSSTSAGGRLTVHDSVVIRAGQNRAGQRGTIIRDDGPDDDIPYNVQFEDDEEDWFKADQVVSAGTEAAEALAEAAEAQQEAEQEATQAKRDAEQAKREAAAAKRKEEEAKAELAQAKKEAAAAARMAEAKKEAVVSVQVKAAKLGLLATLEAAGVTLSDATIATAVAWCEVEEVADIDDIVNFKLVDEFVAALELKTIPREKMLAALKPKSGMGNFSNGMNLPTAFRQYDTDGNGYLDEHEFVNVLTTQNGGQAMTAELAKECYDYFDADGNGKLDYNEFCNAMAQLQAGTPTDISDLQNSDSSLSSTSQLLARLTDLADEPLALIGPITGIDQTPRVSLFEAAMATGVANMDSNAFVATERGAELAATDTHGLDGNETGAFTLYTMATDLYPTMNRLLRQRNRAALKPFFPYLRLLLDARYKLPKYVGVVWRGVKGVDMRAQYPKGQEVYWWAFSSTTKELSTLQNPMFLGTHGVRTIFNIQVKRGVDVVRYSIFQGQESEAEVLLYPGTKLKVVDAMNMGGGLYMIHLEEIDVPVELIK